VGGALEAVKLVMGEQYENAFALVRPPGHHAERFRALGFCIFNNVAIATECLLRKFKLRRVLIFDIDTHHGNGTQQTFYDTDEVLYISLHEDPREFPATGFIDEVGEGRGLGYTVNIPFPFRTDDQIYLKAVREIVTPIVRQYKPQFILVSAGFDGHYTDPVGRLSLSALSYSEVFAAILNLASETCGGRLVSVLEGGYSSEFVGVMAASTIARMSGNPCVVSDQILPARRKVRIQAEEVLEKVKKVQRSFWDIY
jgi:acetoin utilization deacetylase AcuC-like enzyme